MKAIEILTETVFLTLSSKNRYFVLLLGPKFLFEKDSILINIGH